MVSAFIPPVDFGTHNSVDQRRQVPHGSGVHQGAGDAGRVSTGCAQKAFALSGDTPSLWLVDGWHNFDKLAGEILGSDSDA